MITQTADIITTISNDPIFPGPAHALCAEGDCVYLNNQKIRLGKMIGKGGEGTVYEYGNNVIKIYSSNKITPRLQHKLSILTSIGVNDSRLVVPKSLICDAYGNVIGFLMNKAHGTVIEDCLMFDFGPWTRIQLIDCVSNILAAFSTMHHVSEHRILIGDINLKNILVDDDGSVFILDMDSVQIDGFPCPVGTPQFASPRLSGKEFSSTLRTSNDELFAICVLVFLLFMGNVHPYQHKNGGSVEHDISEGIFPYNIDGSVKPNAPAGEAKYRWPYLNDEIRKAFIHAFDIKDQFPTIYGWQLLLEGYKNDIREQVRLGHASFNCIDVDDYPPGFSSNINRNIYEKQQSGYRSHSKPQSNTNFVRCEICGDVAISGDVLCNKHRRSINIKKNNAINDYKEHKAYVSLWIKEINSAEYAIYWYQKLLKKFEREKFKDLMASREVQLFLDNYRNEFKNIQNNSDTIDAISADIRLCSNLVGKISDTTSLARAKYSVAKLKIFLCEALKETIAKGGSNGHAWALDKNFFYHEFLGYITTFEHQADSYHQVTCSKCNSIHVIDDKEFKNLNGNPYICFQCNQLVEYKCPVCGTRVKYIHHYEEATYKKSLMLCPSCSQMATDLIDEFQSTRNDAFGIVDFLDLDFYARKQSFFNSISNLKNKAIPFSAKGLKLNVGYDIDYLSELMAIECEAYSHLQNDLRENKAAILALDYSGLIEERGCLCSTKRKLENEAFRDYRGKNIPYREFPVNASAIGCVSSLLDTVNNSIKYANDAIKKTLEYEDQFLASFRISNSDSIDFSARVRKFAETKKAITEKLRIYATAPNVKEALNKLDSMFNLIESEEWIFSRILNDIHILSSSSSLAISDVQTRLTKLIKINNRLLDKGKNIFLFADANKPKRTKYSYSDFPCFNAVVSILNKAIDREKRLLIYVDGSMVQAIKDKFTSRPVQYWEYVEIDTYAQEIKSDDFIPDEAKTAACEYIARLYLVKQNYEDSKERMMDYCESIKSDFALNYSSDFLKSAYLAGRIGNDGKEFADDLEQILNDSLQLEAVLGNHIIDSYRKQIKVVIIKGFVTVFMLFLQFSFMNSFRSIDDKAAVLIFSVCSLLYLIIGLFGSNFSTKGGVIAGMFNLICLFHLSIVENLSLADYIRELKYQITEPCFQLVYILLVLFILISSIFTFRRKQTISLEFLHNLERDFREKRR